MEQGGHAVLVYYAKGGPAWFILIYLHDLVHSNLPVRLGAFRTTIVMSFTDCTGEAMDVDEPAASGAAATEPGTEHAHLCHSLQGVGTSNHMQFPC